MMARKVIPSVIEMPLSVPGKVNTCREETMDKISASNTKTNRDSKLADDSVNTERIIKKVETTVSPNKIANPLVVYLLKSSTNFFIVYDKKGKSACTNLRKINDLPHKF